MSEKFKLLVKDKLHHILYINMSFHPTLPKSRINSSETCKAQGASLLRKKFVDTNPNIIREKK